MTWLTVPILVESAEQALGMAACAAERGADLVELRIDHVAHEPELVELLLERVALPCILTCRPVWEGGGYDGDDADRIALLERLVLGSHPPAYLDIELAAYQRSANLRQKVGLMVDHDGQRRAVGTGLILSSHDFQTRPADLDRRVAAMAEAGACRVIKVAWSARSLRDNVEAFELVRRRLKPTIALCMGEAGLASRVLAKKFGALLTFAALDDTAGTAPGQPTVEQLKGLYRWDAIGPDTKVYGVVGHPVGHSLSPHIHNAAFDATGFDGVYLPMPIPPEYEHFKATMISWLDDAALDFCGASVTIPHKANLLRFVAEQNGEVEPLAQRIGVANTLTVRVDGSLYASNTDYAALLDAVCAARSIERGDLAGCRVAVLGAGGAARAAVAAFAACDAVVTVLNRTPDKARALAGEFGAGADALGAVDAAGYDIVINATPVGMHPEVDASPMGLDGDAIARREVPPVVFDTIYNPVETKLLRDAAAAGCVTIPGTEMFVRQGAAQFEAWTGLGAPLGVFRRVLLERLAGG